MKKTISGLIILLMYLFLLPMQVFAADISNSGTLTVGVTIPANSLSATVSISTDVRVDLDFNKNYPAYIEVTNNSDFIIKSTITDISAGVDAPDTFVSYGTPNSANGKDWTELNNTETMTYIAFAVSSDGTTYTDLLPSSDGSHTDIELGTIVYDDGEGGYDSTETYKIAAKTGFNWSSTTTYTYSVTIVTSVSEDNHEYNIYGSLSDKIYYSFNYETESPTEIADWTITLYDEDEEIISTDDYTKGVSGEGCDGCYSLLVQYDYSSLDPGKHYYTINLVNPTESISESATFEFTIE